MNRNEWANIYKSEVVREEKGCPTMNITYRGCNLAGKGGGGGWGEGGDLPCPFSKDEKKCPDFREKMPKL